MRSCPRCGAETVRTVGVCGHCAKDDGYRLTVRGALRQIADEPCDHGPGFCPRQVAREALQAAPTP